MKYLSILLVLLLSSCIEVQAPREKTYGQEENQGRVKIIYGGNNFSLVKIIEVDSVEYLVVPQGGITPLLKK